jgi:hypothetical protein
MHRNFMTIAGVVILMLIAVLLTYKVIHAAKNNQKIKFGIGPLYLEA